MFFVNDSFLSFITWLLASSPWIWKRFSFSCSFGNYCKQCPFVPGLPLSPRQDIGEMPPPISYDWNTHMHMHENTLCAEGLKCKRIESSMRFSDAQVFVRILFLPMNIWCFLFALLMYLSQMFCFGFILCILTLELYMFDLTCQK